LLSGGTTAALRSTTTIVVVIVVVVTREDALPQLLLPAMDIGVQLVAVLTDRKLLVIVNGDVDAARAYGLILRVMELSNIRVT